MQSWITWAQCTRWGIRLHPRQFYHKGWERSPCRPSRRWWRSKTCCASTSCSPSFVNHYSFRITYVLINQADWNMHFLYLISEIKWSHFSNDSYIKRLPWVWTTWSSSCLGFQNSSVFVSVSWWTAKWRWLLQACWLRPKRSWLRQLQSVLSRTTSS